jgi:DNA-binding XRE family transcriptional regulator
MSDKNLRKRTVGERFWLIRTHERQTQAQVAKAIGISERLYNHIERNIVASRPPGAAFKPSPGLLCALARRRDGRSLRSVAKALGISHVTLLVWEKTDCPELVKMWKRRGYEF